MNQTQPYRILCLGDSYTIGEGVLASERFPAQLARRLEQAGFELSEPQIVARTGWTTGELLAALEQARESLSQSRPFHLVTLLIGVNNQYRGRPLDEYKRQFGELLEQAVGFAASQAQRVIILSIPDWGVTPFAAGRERTKIAAEIDAFNLTNLKAARVARIAYVDVTEISRRAAVDPDLLAGDSLHPSARMYAEWVEALWQPTLTALQTSSSPTRY